MEDEDSDDSLQGERVSSTDWPISSAVGSSGDDKLVKMSIYAYHLIKKYKS